MAFTFNKKIVLTLLIASNYLFSTYAQDEFADYGDANGEMEKDAEEEEDDDDDGEETDSETKSALPEWLSGEGATLWEGRRTQRVFEIGIFSPFNIGVSNSMSTIGNLLSGDMSMGKLTQDFAIEFDAFVKPISVSFNIGSLLSLSIFTGFNVSVGARADKGLFDSIEVLQSGDSKNIASQIKNLKGNLIAGASAFAEIGASASKTLLNERLWVKASPSLYFTIFYMNQSAADFKGFDDSGFFGLNSNGGFEMYSADPDIIGSDMFSSPGVDLSVEGRYALFQIADVGLAIDHIPLVPSTLHYKKTADLSGMDIKIPKKLDSAMQFEMPEDIMSMFKDAKEVSQVIARPVRFDFYALFKPFKTHFVVVKPNLGFSLNTLVADATFNWGLEGQLNLPAIISIAAGLNSTEEIYTNYLRFEFDLHVFEFDIGASLRGPDFISSWQAKGMNLYIGFKFGA